MLKHFFTLVTLFTVLSGSFTSCSDDDDNGFPVSLSYKSTENGEFKLYVGSENGGKEVSTENIDSDKFWNDKLHYFSGNRYGGYNKEQEEYEDDNERILTITFMDATNFEVKSSDNTTVLGTYRFDKGQLFVKSDRTEVYIGDGDINNLRLYNTLSFYTTTNENGGSSGFSSGGGKYTLDNIFDLSGSKVFSSLSDMKQVTDSICWNNRYDLYTR